MSSRVVRSAALVSAVGYAGLWLGYAHGWGWLADADDAVLRVACGPVADRPAWVAFWTGVSAVLGPTALRVLAVVGIAAVLRRSPRTAAFLALTVLGMGLVTAGAKAVVDRPRPASALTAAASSSFPSGHALGAMAATLAFLAVLVPLLPGWARGCAVAAGVAVVLLVGTARVALNVHHPSDVLAGWALGYLWFLLCLTLVPPGSRPPDRRPVS